MVVDFVRFRLEAAVVVLSLDNGGTRLAESRRYCAAGQLLVLG